jgi:hypothetical protein
MGVNWKRAVPTALILLPLVGIGAFGLLGGCATVGIEKAKYSVLETKGKIEVRMYEPSIVAETAVDASFDEAGDTAFGRLFGYISGENRTQHKIAMTAPVNQEPAFEKIAMTTPVSQQRAGGRYVVSFLMPSEYTMETLPEPTDPAVELRRVPQRRMAAIRYSGGWSKERYEKNLARLEAFIQDERLEPTGEPIFARYDPPFQLPFFRRNEVLIPVQ